jgi:hypothetical protein
MNVDCWNSALKTVLVVALLGVQGVVLAGRIDSSMNSFERAQGLDKHPAAENREQIQPRIVLNNTPSDSAFVSGNDAQLADYLEMHGRVIEGSIRSTMMPWSALQQVAN